MQGSSVSDVLKSFSQEAVAQLPSMILKIIQID